MSLQLYGHWVSQPSRAVMWLCMLNNLSYEYKHTDPLSGATRTAEFKSINPAHTIPTIVDTTNNLTLFESNAIMVYLVC